MASNRLPWMAEDGGQNDLLATILGQQPQQQEDEEEQFSPFLPNNDAPVTGGEETQEPPADPSTTTMPSNPATPGAEAWKTFLASPESRAFMVNMGLQLMTGGWGNTMSQVGEALGAGLAGAAATQQGVPQDAMPQPGQRQAGGRAPAGGRGLRNAPRGRPRRQSYSSTPVDPAVAQAQLNELNTAEQFIQSNPTPEQWNAANQEGGIIYAQFGGPQLIENRNELLQQISDKRREFSLGRGNGTATVSEMYRLLQSTNPEEVSEGQIIAQRLYGNPGVRNEYRYDPETRRVRRMPLEGSSPGGAGGSPQAAAARAGVMTTRNTIRNLRDYIENQVAVLGNAERFVSQYTGVGPYARATNSMLGAVASFMHARSGAQTSVKEFENYLKQFMPSPGDADYTIRYKLADLEYQVLTLLQSYGERIPPEIMQEAQGNLRRELGLRPNNAPAGPPAAPPPGPPPAAPSAPPAAPAEPDRRQQLRDKYGLE